MNLIMFKYHFISAFTILFFSVIFIKSQSQSEFFISDSKNEQNVFIDCNYPFVKDNSVLLKSNYPSFKLTNKYIISAINYTPYSVSNKVVIKDNLDDSFSEIIDLPFQFCFYGQAYNQLVIGSNGMVSFDINQAGQANAPNISEALPSSSLPKATIFGVLHDMYFSLSDDSEINYSVIGNAPFRKFVINFYKGRMSGCDDSVSTSQIVLSEGSNNIEVFVENKSLACDLAKFKNSLIGINDEIGDSGLAAPNRNTGIWQAQNEAWLFTPDGENVVPKFAWYDGSGNLIGSSNEQIVSPKKDENYRLDFLYTICNGQTYTYTDEIDITFSSDYPTTIDYSKIICNSSEQIVLSDYKKFLTTNDFSKFSFVFIDALSNQILDETIPITVDSSRDFNVIISNKDNRNCKRSTTLSFQYFSQNILTNQVSVCDLWKDGKENDYLLSNLNVNLVGSNFKGEISYFLTRQSALDNINSVTTYNLENNTQFYIRVSQNNCYNVFGPISIKLTSPPQVVSPLNLRVQICDLNYDGVENFNWGDYLKDKVTTDLGVSIRVFKTYDEALSALSTQLGLDKITKGNYKVYARVEFPGACFSIAEINMDVVLSGVELKNIDTYICFDGAEDITVDLLAIANNMLVNPNSNITGPFFFTSNKAAIDNLPANMIPSTQVIKDDGNYISKIFYVRFNNGTDCYTIKPIKIYLVHLVKNKDQFNICDVKNDNSETITLSTYAKQINNQSGSKVFYFNTEAQALANVSGTDIKSLTVTSSQTVYARITIKNCLLIIPVTFTLVKTPDILSELTINLKDVCDNNADGKENVDLSSYATEINVNKESVDFTYFKTYNPVNNTLADPYSNVSNVEVQDGTIIYVKVKFKDSDCFSVSKIIVNIDYLPSIKLSKTVTLKKCDDDFDFGEYFDLSESILQLYDPNLNSIPLSDLIISYYECEDDANVGTTVGKINSLYHTHIANAFVYVRFQSKKDGCYSVAPINLLSYFPTKAKNSVISICDNNLDGYYDVNLLEYKNYMVQNPDDQNVYKFYLRESDINIPGKEIKNPEKFKLNPYISKIWVYVENLTNCGSIAEVNFKKGNILTLNKNQFSINNICDTGNDGKEQINLTIFENNFSASYTYEYFEKDSDMWQNQNKIQNPAYYAYDETKGSSTFYVKVSQEGFCPNFYSIEVQLNKMPIINIADYYYCKNASQGLEIKPNFSTMKIANYRWELPDGTIIEGADKNYLSGIKTIGTYTLSLTTVYNCSYTTSFRVLNVDTPEIVSLIEQDNNFEVTAQGISGKKIVYSKDSVHWQDSNVFYNLAAGEYNFYAKYADSDCYSDAKKGKIFTVQSAFTPNGDGINDYWVFSDLDVFGGTSTLQIVDKFGKVVCQQTSNKEFRWDGKIQSRSLNTDAYWYVIKVGNGRIYQGWIFLKNRN